MQIQRASGVVMLFIGTYRRQEWELWLRPYSSTNFSKEILVDLKYEGMFVR